MEAFTDPVGQGMPGLRAGVMDVLHGQIQFIFMTLRGATVLSFTVGLNPIHWNLLLLKERQDPIIEQVRGRIAPTDTPAGN